MDEKHEVVISRECLRLLTRLAVFHIGDGDEIGVQARAALDEIDQRFPGFQDQCYEEVDTHVE